MRVFRNGNTAHLGGDVVDVELVVPHAQSKCMAIAIQCDNHDGGSPHLQHDQSLRRASNRASCGVVFLAIAPSYELFQRITSHIVICTPSCKDSAGTCIPDGVSTFPQAASPRTASGDSPWHSLAKPHLLAAGFFRMTPFRSMLLTVQSGLQSFAPGAQSVPTYAQVWRHSSLALSRRTPISW